MKKILIVCLLLLCLIGKLEASEEKIINEKWLKNNNQELGVDKNIKYSIALLPLTGGGEAVYLNNKEIQSLNLMSLPIMVEAYNQRKQAKINFDDKIVIDKSNKVKGGPLYDLPDGKAFTIKDLVRYMVANDDNTARKILINKLGVANINTTIKNLELEDTQLKSEKDGYTTAKDISELLGKLYWLNCIAPDSDQEMLDIVCLQTRNDMIPAFIARNVKIAHVPDETSVSLKDCAVIYGEDNDYIICIMTDKVTDKPRTAVDIAKISQSVYEKLQ